jgi:antitoxin ParD1/3/4
MNISLTPYLEQYIHKKVKCGLYNSASEVVRDSLRFMIEEEKQKTRRLEDLNNEIERGLEQLTHGEKIPAEDVFKSIYSKRIIK